MAKLWNNISIGVQSYCFREFDNMGIVEHLRTCGVSAIELCNKHVDLNNAAQAESVLQLYRSHGVSISSFGIKRFENNEDIVRPIFEFARSANIAVLGASPDPDAYDMLERLCKEYGVRMAIHNHGRQDKKYGTIDQLSEALGRSSDWLGLCLDTGWMIDTGADPVQAVKRFGSRIYGIHFKDFSYNDKGERSEAILGQGSLNLHEFLNALRTVGFDGYASIEYEGEPSDPVSSIRRCVEELVKAI